ALACGALLLSTLGAAAQPQRAGSESGPAGIWRVEDGKAVIRIVDCGGQYWGVVAWEKTPGTDSKNPDPALKSRSTLGMPVLLGMHRSGQDKWTGHIYNAEDGQTYEGHISLTSANALRVEGCVLGIMCGGETWSRTGAPRAAVAQADRHAGAHSTTGSGRPRRSLAEQSSAQICSAIGRR
ncbi:MAG: DUF2147 domain-containing protein, partial [Candidatus Eiseniibacteriota bacterium]